MKFVFEINSLCTSKFSRNFSCLETGFTMEVSFVGSNIFPIRERTFTGGTGKACSVICFSVVGCDLSTADCLVTDWASFLVLSKQFGEIIITINLSFFLFVFNRGNWFFCTQNTRSNLGERIFPLPDGKEGQVE